MLFSSIQENRRLENCKHETNKYNKYIDKPGIFDIFLII